MLLLDAAGRAIPENRMSNRPPEPGQYVAAEPSDRHTRDASWGLTPRDVERIMTMANSGDIAEQCKLALELDEKDWDIFHALDTRRRAVSGVPWTVEPAGESARDRQAADAFRAALEAIDPAGGYDTFNDLSEDLMTALTPGFAVSEIIWGAGGAIAGFRYVEQRHFTAQPDPTAVWHPGRLRLLTTDHPTGVDLPAHKFIIHRYRRRGGDVARGGLIRPLAWMYCFKNYGIKDLEAFLERYGMPFVVARVDKNTWDTERNVLHRLIRNFGTAGGGVFTKATELELLQAPNAVGEAYFRKLSYYKSAIECVVLGQTATSSEGGGLGNNSAQSAVRQDILEADCRLLDATQTAQLAVPWTRFNRGPGAVAPRIVRQCAPPEDRKALAEMVEILSRAGYDADPAEISERTGIKLTRRTAPPPPMAGNGLAAGDGVMLGAEADDASRPDNQGQDDPLIVSALRDAVASGAAATWLGPMAERLAAIARDEDLDALKELTPDDFGDASKIEATMQGVVCAAAASAALDTAVTVAPKRGGATS